MTPTEAQEQIEKAKPCPFCGTKLRVQIARNNNAFLDHPSPGYNCPTLMFQAWRVEAMDKWNKRHEQEI